MTVSNALDKSINNPETIFLLSIFSLIMLTNSNIAVCVPLHSLKPYCLLLKKIATIQEAVHRALYERLKNFINSWQNRNRSIITDFILSLFLVHGNNLSNLKLVWIHTIEHTQVENI